MAELDRDRMLALSYVPSHRRPAVAALWRLDAALGAALAGGREPLISQIKLAWWRDSLEQIDHKPPPGEPVLQALAAELLPLGLRGGQLARMEEGWMALLSPEALSDADLATYAAARGGLLFRITASLLGREASVEQVRAGEAWALVDLARHSANAPDADAAVAAAKARQAQTPWPAALRPLGMLAVLAQRDAEGPRWEEQGAPRRMLRMLRHRITGR
jgi:phytoene synthase